MYVEVEVTAESLNIRQLPTTNSKIIGSLAKGERSIALYGGIPGWVSVITNAAEIGYVSSKYVQIIRIISADTDESSVSGGSRYSYEDEEEACNADNASLNLDVRVDDFDCDENFMSEGFRSCDARISVSITSDCDENMTASVSCDAEFSYRTKDGLFERSDTESGSDSVYVRYGSGSGSIDIDWTPYTILDPVMKARLSDASCRIDYVSDW